MTLPTPRTTLPAHEAWVGLIAVFAACAAPLLLAYNLSPSPTFLNQALAIVLWGLVATLLAWFVDGGSVADAMARSSALLAALLLVAAAALGSWWYGSLPSSLALSGAGLLLAAGVMVVSGAVTRSSDHALQYFSWFCWGWVAAGAINAGIAFVQVFAPSLPDGDWIAHSGIPGRAVGNIRQPNHLSSLLLWSAIGVVGLLELRRIGRVIAIGLFAVMVTAVMLTASRTGMVSVLLLALWGLVDGRRTRTARGILIAAPLIYAAGWALMAWWAASGAHAFGGTARLAEADISGSRFAIWSNSLELIRRQPWTGVGFGEFNFAWSLTPFPQRPIAFFDHTHNLPLQLAVELGLPLTAAVLGLLIWALWRAWRSPPGAGADVALAQRCAWMMVLMIGLHSVFEYPLWYAYFLLPAAWAWGYGLGRGSGPGRPTHIVIAGAVLIAAGALSVVDYLRVVPIFEAPEGAASLEVRVAAGQRSVLFSHHADYAAVTSDLDSRAQAGAFAGATHYLLDTRLMIAWAEALAEAGRVDEARYLVERLREFRNPLAKDFLDECSLPPGSAAAPFQCRPPTRAHDWRAFTQP